MKLYHIELLRKAKTPEINTLAQKINRIKDITPNHNFKGLQLQENNSAQTLYLCTKHVSEKT